MAEKNYESEKEFLKNYDPSKYDRPSVTVDIVILNKLNSMYQILLVKRKNYPFKGKWALPGGFVNMDENLEDAAARELKEETGVDCKEENITIEQLHTFGDVGRDPRTRTISVAYGVIMGNKKLEVNANDDADDAKWFDINKLPDLAFDHDKIINTAFDKLVSSVSSENS